MNNQGDVALILEVDKKTDQVYVQAYKHLDDTTPTTIQQSYMQACDKTQVPKELHAYLSAVPSATGIGEPIPASPRFNTCFADMSAREHKDLTPNYSSFSATQTGWLGDRIYPSFPTKHQGRRVTHSRSHSVEAHGRCVTSKENAHGKATEVFLKTKKKYKPVAMKVRPIAGTLPQHFCIMRNHAGDPLEGMPELSKNPGLFVPTGRYMEERCARLRMEHASWLQPAELNLLDDLMCKQNEAFTWDNSERGSFRRDMFPPVKLAVVEHKPWIGRNFPILPGIYHAVCDLMNKKIASWVYKPSNTSYRLRWFCVAKKDGNIRIIHSLKPLNRVTIQHNGLPPVPDHMAEHFVGRACGTTLDLFVGYDERELDEDSHDFTTFQTPFGAMRLTTLPMGWSNSVPIFHEDVTFILQEEIPEKAIPYIDNIVIIGPASAY